MYAEHAHFRTSSLRRHFHDITCMRLYMGIVSICSVMYILTLTSYLRDDFPASIPLREMQENTKSIFDCDEC